MAADLRTELRERFQAHCGNRRVSEIAPLEGIDLMISFYRECKFPQAENTPFGDMLLFQYGVYDFGRGEHFEFDVTRQVSLTPDSREAADDSIFQLSLTSFFPAESFRTLPTISRWSSDFPTIEAFALFIRSTKGYEALRVLTPQAVELDVDTV